MPTYTDIFGGSTIYPAQQSYLSITTSTNVTLAWPVEQQIGGNVVADIIDINATSPGLNVNLPDARQVSTGYTALFNNVGAQTVTIRDAGGGTIVSLASGTVWQVYLRDNSTLAGAWRTFQYGASVSVVNAAALAGAGLKAISTSLNQSMPVTSFNSTPTTATDSDRARVMQWIGGVGILNLPAPGTVGSDWFLHIRNSGSGNLTLTPASGQIDAASTKVIAAGNGAIVYTDGTNYFTIGAPTGGGASSFDFVSIDASGSGDFVLSGSQLNRIAYRFTGTLTGNRNIVVPGSIQQYWIDNSTTGAFTLTVATSGQVGPPSVTQGQRAILYCDGTNVLDADSGNFTPPLAVSLGGTGASSASTARTNLGSTATGDALFTAASAAAALATVGGVSTALILTAGSGLTGGGDLTANRTFNVGAGAGIVVNADDVALDTGSSRNVDHTGVSITAGSGLTGGGDISASRTLNVGAGTGILVNADDITVDRTSTTATTAVGYLDVPQNAQTANYQLVIGDRGRHFHMNGSNLTLTIPANGTVAFPIGTAFSVYNANSTTVGIAITTDTLRLAGTSTTGTRSLSQYGLVTALKVNTTEWVISGPGLS